jgi:hypothetical protein
MRESIVKMPLHILRQFLYDLYTLQCIQQLLIRMENKKMKTRYWEIIIRYEGKSITTTIDSVYQYDAYIELQKKYPGCIVKKISEIKS